MANRFFFILGLPRSRTAWLSVLLTGRDSFCFHEGTGAFPDFAAYAAALRARPEAYAGDSNPALAEHVDAILAEFPDARFAVIRRDPAEALESFCAAAPREAAMIRAGWDEMVAQFEAAVAKLPLHLTLRFEDLQTPAGCESIHAGLLGSSLDGARWEQLRQLHVTSIFPETRVDPLAKRKVEVNIDGFDFSGLTVRSYTAQDRPMLEEWFAYHKDTTMPQVRLAPLGLVAEDEQGPVAAIWCYETFGVGVAWIALPVTRPGLTYKRACTVMAFAIMAITQLAGTGFEPPASFTCFRVICPPAMGRLLKRLGFTEQPGRSNYFLSL